MLDKLLEEECLMLVLVFSTKQYSRTDSSLGSGASYVTYNDDEELRGPEPKEVKALVKMENVDHCYLVYKTNFS